MWSFLYCFFQISNCHNIQAKYGRKMLIGSYRMSIKFGTLSLNFIFEFRFVWHSKRANALRNAVYSSLFIRRARSSKQYTIHACNTVLPHSRTHKYVRYPCRTSNVHHSRYPKFTSFYALYSIHIHLFVIAPITYVYIRAVYVCARSCVFVYVNWIEAKTAATTGRQTEYKHSTKQIGCRLSKSGWMAIDGWWYLNWYARIQTHSTIKVATNECKLSIVKNKKKIIDNK